MKQTVHIGHRAIALRVAVVYFLAAAAWIVGSDLLMLLWLPESASAVAGSIAKGMAFVLVTSVALYVVLRRVARMESQPAPLADTVATPGKAGWRALAPFVALGLALICTTVLMFVRDASDHRTIARKELESSASLKSRELGMWLKQKSQSALTYGRARFFQDDLRLILGGDGGARERVETRLEEIRKSLEVDAILVLDAQGQTRVAVGGQRGVSADLASAAAEVSRTRSPVLHLLHRVATASDSPLVLDQIVPIELDHAENGAPAVIVLRNGAAGSLFPMLDFRAFESRTAESYLVRRAGDRIEYLSALKEKSGAALTLGPLAADTERASAQLIRDPDFTERAIDYRGVPVLAVARRVSGTDWHVISKIDVDEVLAPARVDAAMFISVIVGLTLLAALGARRMWRQQVQLAGLRERTLAAERDVVGKHLDLLSRHANDMIFLIDPQGRIAEANERAIERYRYPRERLIGMMVADLRPPGERAEGWAHRASVLRDGGEVYEARHMTADGELFTVEVSARSVESDGATYIQSINRDISERKSAEARIGRLNRLRDALSATNRAIVRKKSEQGLFEKICEIVVEKAGFRFAWIAVAGPRQGVLQPAANAGTPEEYLAALRSSFENPAIEDFGIMRSAMRDGRMVVAQDFANDPRMAPWRNLAREWGIGSMAAVPILKDGKPYALLNVYSDQPNTFDDEYVSLLDEMASDVSFALDGMKRELQRKRAEDALSESESTYRSLFENMLNGFAYCRMLFEDGRPNDFVYLDVNRAFEALTGLKDVVGRKVSEVIPGIRETDPKLLELYGRVALTGRPETAEIFVEALQSWFWISVYSPKRDHFVAVFDVITERKRAEKLLKESEQRFRALLEQSIAAVYVIQDDKIVYANPRMREIFGYGPEEPFDPDPMSHIAAQERARVAEQMTRRLSDEPEAAYSVAATRKDGTAFTIGVHAKQASFDGRPAIIAIAQDITEKARAEEEIKRYITRLEQAMQSTVNVVATIGELRDPYTHGHERRVGEVAAAIAAEMGLDASRVEGIRIAGYLHDVGKIGVPAEILAKPTRLTKAEFDLVKDHARQSHEILKGVEFPWPVAEAAWQHHERIDGSGYPRGLKGEEVILEARILAVADVVEAMSSHRPYRPGLGIDAALAEIEKCRGRLYDPGAVDACLRLFREKGYCLPA